MWNGVDVDLAGVGKARQATLHVAAVCTVLTTFYLLHTQIGSSPRKGCGGEG